MPMTVTRSARRACRIPLARLVVLLVGLAAAPLQASDPAARPLKDDPFAAPLTPLARFLAGGENRVRVRGTVRSSFEGGTLVLQEGDLRVRVRARQDPLAREGDRVEAVGVPGREDGQLVLGQSLCRVIAPRKDAATEFLPLLQAVRDVRTLTPDEARKGYPVRLTGVVTYYDPGWNCLFIQDVTNGIYVNPGKQLAVRVGQTVELTGFSAPGDFAPVALGEGVKILGRAQLPPARAVPFAQLLTGREDSQRVTLEGVIRSAVADPAHLHLEIADGTNLFTAVVPAGVNRKLAEDLIDARVRLRGVCGTIFNQQRQIIGVRLFTPSQADVEVLEAPPRDAFAGEAASIASVLQFNPEARAGRRVKVAGRVIWGSGGKVFYLRDSTGGLRVELDAPFDAAPGDAVEVAGFPSVERFAPALQHATARQAPRPAEAVEAREYPSDQLLEGNHDAELVRLEARLVDLSKHSDGFTLVLQDGRHVFDAALSGPAGEALTDLLPGSRLAVTGVCQVRRDWQGSPQSFRILLRDGTDVMLLEASPWWTARHTLGVLGGAGFVTLAALAWVVSLRRRVRRQTDLIRQRLQSELALEARYQELFENARDLIFTTDPAGNLTSLNRAAEDATGYRRDEILGRGLSSLLAAGTADPLAGGAVPATQEICLRAQGGRELSLEVSLRPIVQEGRTTGFQGIARDVTERKRFQADLLRAKETADAASRAKSEFLANMSHEIRTPMNGILGMTELALQTDLHPEQREYLTTVRASAEALLDVINDVLDFSKIEAGKLSLDPDDFRLRESLGAALKPLALRAHQKKVELACRVAPDVPDALVGDAGRLRQILTNLVGNAIKFTHAGEVFVEVGVEDETLTEVGLHFRVTDTGIGIPAAKLDTIFEPFEQADGSLTRRYGGTGLGLSICRRLADLMGGRIWAESEPGRGSTFHVTARFGLQPLSRSLLMAVRPVNLHGLPVLVVDDNATNRRILEEMLGHWDMRPNLTEGGTAALDALRQAARAGEPFPLVLLDSMMPEMGGLAVAEEISRHPEWGRPAVLVLSSAGGPDDPEHYRDLGVATYLTKPVTQSDLLRAIQNCLGKALVDARGRSVLPADGPQSTADIDLRVRPLRVLLAEDNPVNQRLGALLLGRMGHTVTVVGNGREALDALERQAFDLVLMDVQMPELDGLEATRTLRQCEARTGAHLPVIALTAYAMTGDRERCLRAGMDVYLSKPIQEKELARALREMFAPDEGVGHTNGKPARPVLDRAALLGQLGGDTEVLQQIVELFLGEYPQTLQAIRDAVAAADAVALGKAAHYLKGMAGGLAAQAVYETAARLEAAARRSELGAAAEMLAELEAQAGPLQDALAELVGTPA